MTKVIFLAILIGVVAYIILLAGEKPIRQTMLPQDTMNDKKNAPTEVIKQFPKAPDIIIDTNKNYVAVLQTSMGDIKVKLYAAQTPKTVNNFVFLASKDFYDKTIFHRVIKEFMIQGGDPMGTGAGGPGYEFEDEIVSDLVFDRPGLLAMANRGPGTNGSQFFITVGETAWLTGKHTIFGEVVEGMDVVNKIVSVQSGPNDKPVQDVVLDDVVIEE